MKPADNINKLFKKSKITVGKDVDKKILNKAAAALPQPTQQPDRTIWSIIMHSKITKPLAAAIVIIAVLTGIYQLTGSIDGASIAWAEVTKRIANVDYLHYYEITNPENGFPNIREGWYYNGKTKDRSCSKYSSYGAYQSFDNGITYRQLDRHNNVTVLAKSHIAQYDNIYEAFVSDILSFDHSQFQDYMPTQIGDDFLIYEFDPPEEADWIEKISVTVGKNSLTPTQIKTYYKKAHWHAVSLLIIFDYEAPPKEDGFFDPPTKIKPPHGIGQIALGGESVEINLHDTPGIEKAIVRLHSKFDGPAEDLLIPYRERYIIENAPMYFMEITFITDEGYRSNTMKKCPLWIDKGVKAALGKKEIWPDNKDRNIRFTPVLRTTDKEHVFLLELSAWLRIKEPLNL